MAVWTWIEQNKEWVFDGFGVAVVIALIDLIRRIVRKREQTPGAAQITASGTGATNNVLTASQQHTTHNHFYSPVEHVHASEPAGHASGHQPPSPPRRISKVTAKEIHEELKEAAPLQQPALADSYKGSWVRWDVFFTTAWNQASNEIYVKTSAGKNPPDAYIDISFLVQPNEYQELNYMKAGARITVEGKIAGATPYYINLKEVELSFP